MPLDSEEQDKIREKFAGQPGAGQLAVQAATAYANARDLGLETQMEADARRLEWVGYTSDAQRETARKDAATKRKEAAESEGEPKTTKQQPAKQPAPAKQAPGKATRGGEQG